MMKAKTPYFGFFVIIVMAIAIIFVSSCKKKTLVNVAKEQQVVSSEWLNTEFNNQSFWSKTVNLVGEETFNCEFDIPAISEELLKNASVLVYAKFYGYEPTIWPDEKIGLLPKDIFRFAIGGSMDYWSAAVSPGKVGITVLNNSGKFPGKVNPEIQFRLIVVPKTALIVTGTKPLATNPLGKYTEGELRELSYDQLCSQAGLSK